MTDLQRGLVGALEIRAEEFEEKTGIPCRLTVKAGDLKLEVERSVALFRIFQEALTNVARHAQGTEAEAADLVKYAVREGLTSLEG